MCTNLVSSFIFLVFPILICQNSLQVRALCEHGVGGCSIASINNDKNPMQPRCTSQRSAKQLLHNLHQAGEPDSLCSWNMTPAL